MRASIDTRAFKDAIGRAQKAVDEKAPIQALSHLKILASAGALVLTGSDMESAIETRVEADVQDGGVLVLPAKSLSNYVSLLSGDRVEIESDGVKAKLKCGKSRGRITGLSPGDFPVWPEQEPEGPIVIPDWERLHRLTSFTIPGEHGAYNFCALLIETDGEKGHAISLDGYRMSVMDFDCDAPEGSVLIDRSGIAAAKALGSRVELRWGKSSVALDDGVTCARVRRSAIAFPDWRRFVPKNGERLRLDIQDLDRAVRRVAALGEVRDTVRPVRISVHSGVMKISSESPDSGAVEEIACEGGDAATGMASNFLTEALSRVVDEPDVSLSIESEGGGKITIRAKEYVHTMVGIKI